MSTDSQDLLRFNDACTRLGCSRPTLYRWIDEPSMGLRLVKIGQRASGVVGVFALIARRVQGAQL